MSELTKEAQASRIGASWHIGPYIWRRLRYPCLSLLDPVTSPITAYCLVGLVAHHNFYWLAMTSMTSVLNLLAFQAAAYGLSRRSHKEINDFLDREGPRCFAIDRIYNHFGDPDGEWAKFASYAYHFPESQPSDRVNHPVERELVIMSPNSEAPQLSAAKSYASVYGINLIVLDTILLSYDLGPNFTLHHELGHVSNAGLLAAIYEFFEGGFFLYVCILAGLSASVWWVYPILLGLFLNRSFYYSFAVSNAIPEIVADTHAMWHLPARYARQHGEATRLIYDRRLATLKTFDPEWLALRLRRDSIQLLARVREVREEIHNDPRRRPGSSQIFVPIIMGLLAIPTLANPQIALIALIVLILGHYGAMLGDAKRFHNEYRRIESTLGPYVTAFDAWQDGPQRAHLYEMGLAASRYRETSSEDDLIEWFQLMANSPFRTEFEVHMLNEAMRDGALPKEVLWPKE